MKAKGHCKSFLGFQTALRVFLEDEQGQSTTEYILILSVVVMIALKFKATFSKQLGTMLTQLDGEMSSAMNDSGT